MSIIIAFVWVALACLVSRSDGFVIPHLLRVALIVLFRGLRRIVIGSGSGGNRGGLRGQGAVDAKGYFRWDRLSLLGGTFTGRWRGVIINDNVDSGLRKVNNGAVSSTFAAG